MKRTIILLSFNSILHGEAKMLPYQTPKPKVICMQVGIYQNFLEKSVLRFEK